MAANPVPVSVLGDNLSEQTKRSKKIVPKSAYKFLQRIDGPGQYARIIFYTDTLDQANNTISMLHGDKIFDNYLTHAYTKRKDGREKICVHGIFHLVNRDIDLKCLRAKLPKASISVSYYPEAPYPQPKFQKQAVEVVSQGYQTFNPNINSFDSVNRLYPQEEGF